MAKPNIQTLNPNPSEIQGFPLSRASSPNLPLYLPPDFEESKASDYPLVFLLSGWGSASEKWTHNFSSFGKSLPELFDEEILSGRMKSCLVAFPDGRTRLGHSQYLNSPANGNFSNYLSTSCLEAVEDFCKTKFNSERCIIAGHSSGGFGALRMGMERPEKFAYICSVAGDGCFDLSILPCLIPSVTEIQKAGGVEPFLEDALNDLDPGSWSGHKFKALMTLGLASCYSPKMDAGPLFGELFFDTKTGKVDQKLWSKWKSHDPVEMVSSKLEQLKKLKWILLDCGTYDEYAAQLAHRQISKSFDEAGITQYDLWEYKGRHSGQHHRFVQRIKYLLSKMG